jgi:hypothetical protein
VVDSVLRLCEAVNKDTDTVAAELEFFLIFDVLSCVKEMQRDPSSKYEVNE